MPEPSVAGRSIVTRRAIVDIVRTAVQSSYGVTGFADPSLGRRILRWIGLDRPGIRLDTDGGLRLELFLKVAFGIPVAEVARQVDSAVRYSLRMATGVEIESLAIHIDGLRYEPSAVQRAQAIERAEPIEPAVPPDTVPAASASAEGAPRRRRRTKTQ
jgi:uncharacterized alkaline shock family protein YloU